MHYEEFIWSIIQRMLSSKLEPSSEKYFKYIAMKSMIEQIHKKDGFWLYKMCTGNFEILLELLWNFEMELRKNRSIISKILMKCALNKKILSFRFLRSLWIICHLICHQLIINCHYQSSYLRICWNMLKITFDKVLERLKNKNLFIIRLILFPLAIILKICRSTYKIN